MHSMKVQTKYYRLLKSGEKTIELRLFDEKRQQISVGDEITFSDLSDSGDSFKATVLNLYRAKSFRQLCGIIKPQQAGFSSTEELIPIMEEFYSPQKQKEYGVVGIEIRKIET